METNDAPKRKIKRKPKEALAIGSDPNILGPHEGDNGGRFLFRRSVAGKIVSPSSALGLSAYFACIRNISEDIAKLPIAIVEEQDDGTRKLLPDHPLATLFDQAANEDMTAQTMKEAVNGNALGWGDGIAEILRDPMGRARGLYPIHPSRVQIRRDKETDRLEYRIFASGDPLLWWRNQQPQVILDQHDVFHLKGFGMDGLRGYSVAQLAAESLGGAMAAQEFASAFFGNGAHAGTVLTHPNALSPEAKQRLVESVSDMHTGTRKSFRTMVLEEGMKWETLSVNPRDAQFIEGRMFAVEEIARWFRVPPHKIQHLERATFSNIESQAIEYVTDALLPWITRWEQEVARKLFLPSEKRLRIRFDVGGLMLGDQASRSSYYASMFNMGALSINEIRAMEHQNPIEHGDEHFVQLNMQSVEEAAEGGPVDLNLQQRKQKMGEKKTKQDTEEKDDPEKKDGDEIAQAFRPIVARAVKRINDRERKALPRAQKSRKDGEFAEWAAEFYSDQHEYARQAIEPVIFSMGTLKKWGANETMETGMAVDAFFEVLYAKREEDQSGEMNDEQITDEIIKLLSARVEK